MGNVNGRNMEMRYGGDKVKDDREIVNMGKTCNRNRIIVKYETEVQEQGATRQLKREIESVGDWKKIRSGNERESLI